MYQLADKCPISSMESPVPRNLARDFSPTVRRASLCNRIPLPAFSFLVRLLPSWDIFRGVGLSSVSSLPLSREIIRRQALQTADHALWPSD